MARAQALSAEEQAARRDRLAKMRALLFYHERKAARMKAIKSKARRGPRCILPRATL